MALALNLPLWELVLQDPSDETTDLLRDATDLL
jgi:hypothetical protein